MVFQDSNLSGGVFIADELFMFSSIFNVQS